MELERKYATKSDEYYCQITRELDSLTGYSAKFQRYKHYILDTRDKFDNSLAIRVPGKTIGDIRLDSDNRIIDIVLTSKYEQKIHGYMKVHIGKVLTGL